MTENQTPNSTFKDVTGFSEEDFRGRVLLPYLEAVGVGADQIKLEQNFTLKLGKNMVVSSSQTDRTSVKGRLDVLVMNHDGNNLFVVELKRPDLELTDEDVDQGISYARQLDQMAPFVLLTNGEKSQLFDTVTKKEFTHEELGSKYISWVENGPLVTGEDLRLRYEALRHFVGYSTTNLNLFCKTQVKNRIQILTGGPLSVFSDDIYVARQETKERLERFLASDKASFVLSGPSGFGKSNEMCAFALRVLQNHFVLFFNGAELGGGIAGAISDEFNWFFSKDAKSKRVCERIVDLARTSGKPALIVVDAIDESSFPPQPAALSDFSYRIAQYDGNLKLVVSLKSPEWRRFWRLNGVRSRLVDGLYLPETPRGKSSSERRSLPTPSCELKSFTEDELPTAIRKYNARFKSKGYPQRRLQEDLKDPLMLRLFFETFAGLDEIGSVGRDEFAAILKSYIEEKMERLDNPEAGYRALTLIAGAFFEESVQSRSRREGDDEHPVLPQRISVERIRELANGDFSEEFVPSLCNTGVINAFKNERGREEVGFVYERVRDHILACHYLDYEGDLGDDGSRLFKDLDAPATRPITLLHLGTAPDTLWRVFKRYWEQRLHRFLETYSQLREALGPSLRGNIDPYTNSEIRIVYELDRLGRYVWALAAAEDASELVQEYPSLGRLMWSHRQSDEAFRIMHGGDDFALLVDPDVFAAKHFREEIVALTTKAGLEESNSRVLSIEKVLAILHTHRKRLGLPAAPRCCRTFSSGVCASMSRFSV